MTGGGRPAFAEVDRLDPVLDDPAKTYPVFVRMEEQLFRKAGEYEAFCKTNKKLRSELRDWVLETLQSKSNASWEQIEGMIGELQKEGSLKNVKRYWIVNGFACLATGKACRRLAESDLVSFVYLQRIQSAPLHARPVRALQNQERFKSVYQSVIQEWKDDSAEVFSAEGLLIPWNVKRVKGDLAWAEGTTGSGVTIALMDTGMMVSSSLVRALWRNRKEELNGKDDDGNGYVDDLFGYDFNRQFWYALGDGPAITHGSMCAGIMVGRPLNKLKMVTGIAPRARVMALRGMGHLKAYEYALRNGADILSMSYMWPGRELGNFRGIYRLAHEHLAAGGIVSVGGAGNFGPGSRRAAQPAGKQIALPKDIPCVIAAAGILKDGTRPGFSSAGPCYWEDVKFYGDYPKSRPLTKPDVTGCIGGYPVWGRPGLARNPRTRYKLISDEGRSMGLIEGPKGNSFSGPHAGGVAALMLSANPDLNAWEVKALMEQTCKDLGDKGKDPEFGAGLLDALAAVQAAKALQKKAD